MPADFIKRSTSTLLARTLRVYGETTVREGGRYAWFAETADGTTYDQPVCCAIAPVRRKAHSLARVLDVGDHEITLQLDQAALPFVPDPADSVLFVVAPAKLTAAGFIPDPDASKTYLLKSITDPLSGTTACQVRAELHGGE